VRTQSQQVLKIDWGKVRGRRRRSSNRLLPRAVYEYGLCATGLPVRMANKGKDLHWQATLALRNDARTASRLVATVARRWFMMPAKSKGGPNVRYARLSSRSRRDQGR